jgi:hypothetical protein
MSPSAFTGGLRKCSNCTSSRGGRVGHGHGDVVEVLQHPVILAASRPMHELKLEPSGSAKNTA